MLAVAACAPAAAPGVHIDFRVEDDRFRPDYVMFHWLRPGRAPFEERLPENGTFPASGDRLGSLFIETIGPLREARGLAVRGIRAGRHVSGGWLRIDPKPGEQRHLEVVLREPLPDSDANGVPDIVEENCLPSVGSPACAPDVPDAGVPPEPSPPDGGAEDASAPADGGTDVNPPIEDGLVGIWRFDEGAGTAVGDGSGNGNDGMARGVRITWPEGRAGSRALEIPNADNHGVLVPASPSLDAIRSTFTIAAWVQRVERRSSLANVVSRRSTGTSEHFALALTSDGMPRVFLNTHLEPSPALSGPTAIPFQAWVHVATTYDGATLRLYVGGNEVAMQSIATSIVAERTALCIGCGQNNDTTLTEPLAGRLDDLRIYSRALGADEIAALAQ